MEDPEELQSRAECYVMQAVQFYAQSGTALSAMGNYDGASVMHQRAAQLLDQLEHWAESAAQIICVATALKHRDGHEICALRYYKKAAKRYARARMVKVAADIYCHVAQIYRQYEHEREAFRYAQMAAILINQ
jgi:tetratricopeptide (TPR) repeat protein